MVEIDNDVDIVIILSYLLDLLGLRIIDLKPNIPGNIDIFIDINNDSECKLKSENRTKIIITI